MIFYQIPKNRRIKLDIDALKARGYRLPSDIYFKCALGANPFFKLVEAKPGLQEVFGPVRLTRSGYLPIPTTLSVYTQYCVMYDEKCVHIILGLDNTKK